MPHFRRPRSPVLTVRRVASAVLALAALALALRPAPPPSPPPQNHAVAVAATDLAAGTVLGEEHLATAELPAGAVPAGASTEPGPLVGRVLAGPVRAREPVTDVRLVGAGLTAALPPGQVAAPVRLADLAVASLVRTGDRVDVLAAAPGATQAEVVAEGVRVLAAPGPAETSAVDPAGGLLVVAVDGGTAARLAAASTGATLTVTLPKP